MNINRKQYYSDEERTPKHAKGKPTFYDGIWFASSYEYHFYVKAMELVKAGVIKDFKYQYIFPMLPEFEAGGKSHKATTYIADFFFYDSRVKRYRVVDTKGYMEDSFKLKWKFFDYIYRNPRKSKEVTGIEQPLYIEVLMMLPDFTFVEYKEFKKAKKAYIAKNKTNKELDRFNVLTSKDKLTKKETERLEELTVALRKKGKI